MGRPRLTPEEREERRKERVRFSMSDAAYKHYNPRVEGFGSADEWINTAEAAVGVRGIFRRVPGADAHVTSDMRILGLQAMPETAAQLKSAFRRAAMKAHPDHQGGTDAAMREVLAAFKRMAVQYA